MVVKLSIGFLYYSQTSMKPKPKKIRWSNGRLTIEDPFLLRDPLHYHFEDLVRKGGADGSAKMAI